LSDPLIEIRPPWPSETPIFRRLLQGACAGSDQLIAAARATQEILAAAAWSYIDDRARGLLIEVRPAHRQQSIGSALATAVIDACRQRGCISLEAVHTRAGDPAAPALLVSMGFHLESTLTSVAGDIETQRAVIAADFARFDLPAGHTLRECHAAALAPLCRDWYSPDHQTTTLFHIANARHQLARVLHRGSQPIAFIFYSRLPNTLTIDLWAASPAVRGTRANLALLASLIAPALADGTRELRFSWTTGTGHTPNLAARYNARTLAIQDRYLLTLLP